MRGRVQKKNSKWYIVLELRDQEGKRKQKWLSPRKELSLSKPATKAQAEAFLVDKLKQMQDGTYFESSKTTVNEYLIMWLKTYCAPNLRRSTYTLYEGFIRNHIIPAFGAMNLNELRPGHVQQLLADKAQELSSGSRLKLFRLMKQALSHAVQWEYAPRNICDAVIAPKLQKPKIEVWSRQEAQSFLKAMKKHRMYMFYLLALTTGMRRGELLGLRWIDIDLKAKRITIRQTRVQSPDGGRFEGTKTKAGERTIDISAMVVKELEKHSTAQKEEFMSLGRPDLDQGLVFTNEKGKPCDPCNTTHLFGLWVNKLGLKKINIHGLRHTYATMLLEEGVNPKVVSERLGHKNISITLQTYSHVLPRIAKDAATKTDYLIQ